MLATYPYLAEGLVTSMYVEGKEQGGGSGWSGGRHVVRCGLLWRMSHGGTVGWDFRQLEPWLWLAINTCNRIFFTNKQKGGQSSGGRCSICLLKSVSFWWHHPWCIHNPTHRLSYLFSS